MTIYKTFKTLESKGVINGKSYLVYRFTSYYCPYDSCLREGKIKSVAEIVFTPYSGITNANIKDQFGNDWYKGEDKYIAYANGVALNVQPTSYYDAYQLISKDANLVNPKMVSGYDYSYNRLGKCYESRRNFWRDEFVPNYDEMFKPKYKIGDIVFYTTHYDSDTRCGERKQIHHFVIKDISVGGGKIRYYNTSSKKPFLEYGDIEAEEWQIEPSVESLCKARGETLYMWHRNGRVAIEPCSSTEIYLRYNK